MDKQSRIRSGQTDTVTAVVSSAGRSSQKGASAIEYVMIIAVIVVAIAGIFFVFGRDDGPIQGAFDSITSFLEGRDGT